MKKAKKPAKASKSRARSAKTGRFVSFVYAIKHKWTTVIERLKGKA
jgi:hypothetical protein